PGQSGNVGDALFEAPHHRLANVRRDEPDIEFGQRDVGRADVPPRRISATAAIARDVETHGQPPRAAPQSQAQRRAFHAVVQEVARYSGSGANATGWDIGA